MPEISRSRFTGFSDLYDQARPIPPQKVCQILLDLLNRNNADLVVDLGCGTGSSTKIWNGLSGKIIGIEPNDDMRKIAERNNLQAEIIDASSYATTLKDNSVDIVTCSQSFHWMEPNSTLKEINRILKPGGMFAVYDCIWPVTISINSELAYIELMKTVNELGTKYKKLLPTEQQWPKDRHKVNIENSNYFRYCREIFFENTERCDFKRFINIALSQGQLQTLMKNHIEEIDAETEKFKTAVLNDIEKEKHMTVSYRMLIGIKKC
jgi:ubiquinone/menaquinone biosynthesis C-methylase UbiE